MPATPRLVKLDILTRGLLELRSRRNNAAIVELVVVWSFDGQPCEVAGGDGSYAARGAGRLWFRVQNQERAAGV